MEPRPEVRRSRRKRDAEGHVLVENRHVASMARQRGERLSAGRGA
ncbi:hypothetical protein ACFPRL_29020 [Pseudoclavibacter helvolus]